MNKVDPRIVAGLTPEQNSILDQVALQKYYVNVKEFGAKGDGVTDDTKAIQDAVNAGDAFFPPGIYLVNPLTPIFIPSNRSLYLPRTTTIQAKTNGADTYHVFRIYDVENVSIDGGGKIIGDRDSHTGTTGESGMGISIYGSKNVRISNIDISKMWGDGIYIGRTASNPQCSNVRLENLEISKVRRNGISVISVDGLHMRNINIRDISGTSPEAGIDFEPNYSTEWITNINAENIEITDTVGHAVVFGVSSISGTKDSLMLNFKNIRAYRNKTGLYLSFGNLVVPKGSVLFEDLNIIESKENGILVEKWSANLPKLKISRPLVRDANTSGATGYKAVAITLRNASSDTWNTLSNVEIYKPIIENLNDKIVAGISVYPAVNMGNRMEIIDPRFINVVPLNKVTFSSLVDKSVVIRDGFDELVYPAPDVSVTTIANLRLLKKITTSSFTTRKTIELDTTISEGNQVTVTSDTTNGVIVWFDASICLPLQSTMNGKIETTQKGASITVVRESYGWRIVSMIGVWTVV